MELFPASAVFSVAAVLVWLIALLRNRAGTSKLRHFVAVALFSYGAASVPVVIAFIFIGLEFRFVTWGGPDNFWIAVGFVSAAISILTSGILAMATLMLLKTVR